MCIIYNHKSQYVRPLSMLFVKQLIIFFLAFFKPSFGDDFPIVAALGVQCFFVPDVFRDIETDIFGHDFDDPGVDFRLIPAQSFCQMTSAAVCPVRVDGYAIRPVFIERRTVGHRKDVAPVRPVAL